MFRPPHQPIRLAVAGAVVAAAVCAPLGASASPAPSVMPQPAGGATSAALVRTARNKKLHHRILVTRRGRSLYALSAEKRGKFICTDAYCLSFWTPLVVARGVRPTGVPSLGIATRPGGKRQVTYRGQPLYTFNEDRRAGDVRGEGFRDVGVWHAVVVRKG